MSCRLACWTCTSMRTTCTSCTSFLRGLRTRHTSVARALPAIEHHCDMLAGMPRLHTSTASWAQMAAHVLFHAFTIFHCCASPVGACCIRPVHSLRQHKYLEQLRHPACFARSDLAMNDLTCSLNVCMCCRYILKLVLPRDYPFSAPDFFMITPNGRFATNTKICVRADQDCTIGLCRVTSVLACRRADMDASAPLKFNSLSDHVSLQPWCFACAQTDGSPVMVLAHRADNILKLPS